jgi:hypothetical protein
MNSSDNLDFQLATSCGICKEKFSSTIVKVRDHAHMTGKYRRALCSVCNSLVRIQQYPVVIGHGINSSELHYILKSLNSSLAKSVKLICKSSDDIVSLKINGIRFFDSKSFLNHNLSTLIHRQRKNLQSFEFANMFPILHQVFISHSYFVGLVDRFCFPDKFLTSRENLTYSVKPEHFFFSDILQMNQYLTTIIKEHVVYIGYFNVKVC